MQANQPEVTKAKKLIGEKVTTKKLNHATLPAVGYLRLHHIIGSEEREIPPIIPICRVAWLNGVKDKRYPQPIKLGRSSLWKVEDILALIEKLNAGETV